ncbi:hypothetical protein HDU92_002122 [Lobulomyces angularis]|nr:hypothetical protein HDU92_002122 [Lobulomyces angularis]
MKFLNLLVSIFTLTTFTKSQIVWSKSSGYARTSVLSKGLVTLSYPISVLNKNTSLVDTAQLFYHIHKDFQDKNISYATVFLGNDELGGQFIIKLKDTFDAKYEPCSCFWISAAELVRRFPPHFKEVSSNQYYLSFVAHDKSYDSKSGFFGLFVNSTFASATTTVAPPPVRTRPPAPEKTIDSANNTANGEKSSTANSKQILSWFPFAVALFIALMIPH